MNSLSKPELAMHKLKGEHKFDDVERSQEPDGSSVLIQRCRICQYEKRTVDPNPYGGQFMGTSTAYVSAVSSMPFYSTTQLRQAVGSGRGSYSPMIVKGINNNPNVTYEYDET